MRLLSKREIDTARVADTKRQYDEGKKLATRVDVLRETTVREEANLKKVREKSVAELYAEINPLIEKREALLKEVVHLEERKKEALTSLEVREERLTQAIAAFTQERLAFATQVDVLHVRKRGISEQEERLITERGRIENFKHTTAENLVQSENTLKAAQDQASDLRKQAQITLEGAELREKRSFSREAEVAVRERELQMRTDEADRREKDLIDREKLLRDRNAMLERNLKRIK